MDPLGKNTQIETVSGATLSNGFSVMPSNDINSIIASNSVKSTNVRSGVNSGAQQIRNSDGSYAIFGINSETNEMGLFFYDANGNLQAKYLGKTDFKYAEDGTNYYQSGTLPDSSRGLVIAKPGENVSDAVT